MPTGKKKCGKCEAENNSKASVCAKCGEPFQIRGKKEKVVDETASQFSAGRTIEWGLLVFWPAKNEYFTLTREETELVAGVLMKPQVSWIHTAPADE